MGGRGQKYNHRHDDQGRFDFKPPGEEDAGREITFTIPTGPRPPADSPPPPEPPPPGNDWQTVNGSDGAGERPQLAQGQNQRGLGGILQKLLKDYAQKGGIIRNKALAGKNHPTTGIPFDKDGFPDFSGGAQKTVKVPHTGNRRFDDAAANRAAGFPETPKNMTWHYHQDGRTFQLVPQDIHDATGHTGSIGIGNLPGKK